MKRSKLFLSSALAISLTVTSAIPVSSFGKIIVYDSPTAETLEFYEYWKDKYLRQDKYVTDETQYYIYYSEEAYSGNNYSVPVTVSEAHGYGMLIFANMAEYDSNSKKYFDGMYNFYKAHPSDIGSHLMSWQQSDNGSALIDGAVDGSMTGGSCDSATDGDMDIAYALLLADKTWGSNGEINYLNEAKAVINDIMKYDINQEFWTISLGDWVSECDDSEIYYHATRPSDFIMNYFPAFARASGDDNWMNVYNTTYEIIDEFINQNDTGLLPDFVIRENDGTFKAAPADLLESEHDGAYYYNSCRTPWRISVDFLINKNKTAWEFANQISDFMFKTSNGDPWEIMAGYELNGTAFEDYNNLCFTAPLLTASLCGNNSEWHDSIRNVLLNYGNDVYYGDTIKLMCLMLDDGCWNTTEYDKAPVIGDVNDDGEFSIADLVALSNYLLGAASLSAFTNADMDHDGTIDVADLIILRKLSVLDINEPDIPLYDSGDIYA